MGPLMLCFDFFLVMFFTWFKSVIRNAEANKMYIPYDSSLVLHQKVK